MQEYIPLFIMNFMWAVSIVLSSVCKNSKFKGLGSKNLKNERWKNTKKSEYDNLVIYRDNFCLNIFCHRRMVSIFWHMDRQTDWQTKYYLLAGASKDGHRSLSVLISTKIFLDSFLVKYAWPTYQHTDIAKRIKMKLWVYSTWMTSFVSSYVLKCLCLRIWQFVLHSFADTKTLVLRSFGIGALTSTTKADT